MATLERRVSEFLRDGLDVYWGDVAGHTVRSWKRLEDLSEAIGGLSTTLESITPNRINEVMKTRTLFSVVIQSCP